MNTPTHLRGHPLPPLPGSIDPHQYCVESRAEVLALLREISARHTLVTIGFGEDGGYMVTTLLEVNAEFEELVFEATVDLPVLERLLAARYITGETMLDSVRIAFSTGRAEAVQREGMDAFRVRIPEAMVRLQRRDAFRISTPQEPPLLCRVRLPADPDHPLQLRVSDLSVSGLSLHLEGHELNLGLEPGMTLMDCHLELPGTGTVRGSLEVVHVQATGAHGSGRRIVGCRFIGLPGPTQTLLQRHVIRLERARSARRVHAQEISHGTP